MSDRPCLVCRRAEDDRIHDPEARKGTVSRGGTISPRIENHPYDPGERRRLIRRQEDREKLLHERVYGAGHVRAGYETERRGADRRKG